MDQQDNDLKEINSRISTLNEIPPLNLIISMIIAPISSILIIFFVTSIIELISRDQWSVQIVWPPLVFIGAFIGGITGSIILYGEIWLIKNEKIDLIRPQLLSSDLLYITAIGVIVYILEIFSESLILQGILFLLEIVWFSVLSWNIGKNVLQDYFTRKADKFHEEEQKLQN